MSPTEKISRDCHATKSVQSSAQHFLGSRNGANNYDCSPTNGRNQSIAHTSVQTKPRRFSATATPISNGKSFTNINPILPQNTHSISNSATTSPPNQPLTINRNRLSFDHAPKSYRRASDSVRPLGHLSSSQSASPFSPLANYPGSAWSSAYPLVSPDQIPSDPVVLSKLTTKNSNECTSRGVIHEGMERNQAEEVLKLMEVGDFLLR